jgi:CRISPR-associated protein Csb2
MPTLIFRFPGGRYHATPWGNHVNEGLIEWPPSPWRLLRALLATGYTALGWPSETPPPIALSLVEKLAQTLPSYRLPPTAGAHSRHYMPLATLDKGREKTTLVFDTWAQVGDGEMSVTWDVVLTDEETSLLADLAARLGYLGRSESWVEARLAEAEEVPTAGTHCLPEDGAMMGPGWEQVPLHAPQTPEAYGQWREQSVSSALTELSDEEKAGKKVSKKVLAQRAKAEAPYPLDLIACLQVRTDWLRAQGWSQPPGSRRVFYWRKVGSLQCGSPPHRPQAVSEPPVEAMLLSLATATGNTHALPPVIRTLPQADLLHRALVSLATRHGGHTPVLSGCDQEGRPLTGPHQHAHILPLDLDGDGRIEHVLLWAPMGIDAAAQAAVRAVRRTFMKGGNAPLRLALAGAGDLKQFRDLPGVYGDGLRQVVGPSAGANAWVSRTPFVPPRHLKKQGKNTLEGQIISELASRQLPEPEAIQVIDPREDQRFLPLRHFIRSRRTGPSPPVDCGFTVTLRFAEAIPGPLVLGYGSHFGLGIFQAKSY